MIYKPRQLVQPEDDSLVQLCQDLDLVDGSILINDAFHDAFVSLNGAWHGPLGPGRYTLDTGFSPWLSGLRTFTTGGRAPIGVNVFFVSKRQVFLPWGTGEVLCAEKAVGEVALQVRAMAGGQARVRVTDSQRFLTALVGLRSYDEADLNQTVGQAILMPPLRSALARCLAGQSLIEAQAAPEQITVPLARLLAPSLQPLGLALVDVTIQSLTLNPEDLARLQELSRRRADAAVELEANKNELDTLYGGNMYNRVAADAIRALAGNPGMAGSPMGQLAMLPTVMGAAGRCGAGLQDMLDETFEQADLFRPRVVSGRCPGCGRALDARHAFCPYCGRPRDP